jgi:hypothetical protein
VSGKAVMLARCTRRRSSRRGVALARGWRRRMAHRRGIYPHTEFAVLADRPHVAQARASRTTTSATAGSDSGCHRFDSPRRRDPQSLRAGRRSAYLPYLPAGLDRLAIV